MEEDLTKEAAKESDPFGRTIGVLAAVIGVFLVVVTIASHRAHTDAIIVRTEANDQWAFYQAKSLKKHTLEVGRDLLSVLPQVEKSEKLNEKYNEDIRRYGEESADIQKDAKEKQDECVRIEKQALRYDLGEGFLELGLVLASLYFLSKKKLFPVVGFVAALSGILIALTGYLIH